MSSAKKGTVSYPEWLAAIGRFAEKKGLDDICILEFENGVILTGSTLYETGEVMGRRVETFVLSYEDIHRMVKGG